MAPHLQVSVLRPECLWTDVWRLITHYKQFYFLTVRALFEEIGLGLSVSICINVWWAGNHYNRTVLISQHTPNINIYWPQVGGGFVKVCTEVRLLFC